MWQPITDCSKQLTIHSNLRERLENGFRTYKIIEVEFDQFHLQLISENDNPAGDLRQVLNCEQLMEYGFEVEIKNL